MSADPPTGAGTAADPLTQVTLYTTGTGLEVTQPTYGAHAAGNVKKTKATRTVEPAKLKQGRAHER